MPKTRQMEPPPLDVNVLMGYIQVIPPELLTLTFEHMDFAEPHVLVTVVLVCKQWRDIIFSNPKFWRSINMQTRVAPAQGNQNLAEFVEKWFDRSIALPLSFRLNICHPQPSAPELISLTRYLTRTKRWKELKFTLLPVSDRPEVTQIAWPWIKELFSAARTISGGRACWESLETLELIARELNLIIPSRMPLLALIDIAPNVKTLRVVLRRFSSIACLRATFINMHNLKTLEIDGEIEWPNPDMLIVFYTRILAEATQLEELKLLDYYSMLALPTISDDCAVPLRNTTLRSLTLHDSPGVRFFLRGIALPSLISLAITKPESGTTTIESLSLPLAESIDQLLSRSGCKLERFKLENVYTTKDGLLGLLPALKTLETLALNTAFGNCNDAIEFLSELKESGKARERNALPKLRGLSFTVGAFITPRTKSHLLETFKAVAEDPKRWWPRSTSDPSGSITTPKPEGGMAQLEDAQLVMHRLDGALSVLFSRGTKWRP